MSLSELMDKVIGCQRERQQTRESDYRALVAQIADGKEPDADRVDDVLNANAKSLADLQIDVQRLQTRRGLRVQYDQLPKLTAEQDRLRKQLQAAEKAFEDAERKHEAVTGPLIARLDEIKEEISAGASARRQLWDTCTDAALLTELNDVTEDLKTKSRHRAKANEEIRQLREWATSDRAAVQDAFSEEQRDALRHRAANRDRHAAMIEQNLKTLADEEAELHRREAAIRERMLEA